MKIQKEKQCVLTTKTTVCYIGAEGASVISESLKINTTLTELYLSDDEIRNKKMKKEKKNGE